MTGHDHDEAFADLLRRTLTDEADAVNPAGDGLSRIRTKLEARRRRMRWLRPAIALGSAAAVALIGLGAYAVVGTGDNQGSVGPVTTSPPSPEPTPSESVSPSPSAGTSALGFPKLAAIYPFTTAAAAKSWDEQYAAQGSQPWIADPKQVAQSFVTAVGVTDVDKVVQTQKAADGTTAVVTLGRTMTAEQASTVAVTDILLQHYLDGWIVTGATDPQDLLRVGEPDTGATVSSPVQVTGPTWGGTEESVNFDLRRLDADGSPVVGSGNAFFGNGPATWSAKVSYSLDTAAPGVLVGTEMSMADGGTQRLVANRLNLTASSASTTAPAYFYGIKNGRVTKFASRNGAAIAYLTAPPGPGGGTSDPQLSASGELVYFLQGSGSCSNSVMSVGVDGTGLQTVATPDSRYAIGGYGISPDGTEVALAESRCSGHGPRSKLVVRSLHLGSETVLDKFAGAPPMFGSDPTWAPDAQSIYVFVRTGMGGGVNRYDLAGDQPSTGCAGLPGVPTAAVDVDSSGTVWVGLFGNAAVTVSTCAGNGLDKQFRIPASQPATTSISVSDQGTVLATDGTGAVWRWDGAGAPVQLTPSVDLFQVTW